MTEPFQTMKELATKAKQRDNTLIEISKSITYLRNIPVEDMTDPEVHVLATLEIIKERLERDL